MTSTGRLLALSPFHDVGLVPGQPFEADAAALMLAIAACAGIAAVLVFERRAETPTGRRGHRSSVDVL